MFTKFYNYFYAHALHIRFELCIFTYVKQSNKEVTQ